MKRPQKILAALAVVLVIAAIALVQTFNVLAVRNRDQVQQELQKVLGKNVNFDSLEVHWLGQPGFVATEFRIADDSRFAATPLLHARELVLGISSWNLLFRRLVIDKLIFNGAEFQIITDETGALNLTTLLNRKNELRGFSKVPPVPAEPKHSAVSFLISDIRVRDGRIEYVDRSVKAPAEIRMKNISMRLKGFARQQATQITFAASLTEGLSQDVRIDGRLEPVPSDPSWLHRPIDLNIRFDSLHVPVVARAIAALRDKIPEELDVTGPMALQAKAGGTVERPRIDSFTLKIPLFGSSDYNAVVDGSIQFTERRLWEDAAIQGKLVVEPLALLRLRPLKFFEQNLPAAFLTDGTVGIYSRFEGTWENLRIGALVRADKAELRYKESLRKPADAPAGQLRLPFKLWLIGERGGKKLDDSVPPRPAGWLPPLPRGAGSGLESRWGWAPWTPWRQASAARASRPCSKPFPEPRRRASRPTAWPASIGSSCRPGPRSTTRCGDSSRSARSSRPRPSRWFPSV